MMANASTLCETGKVSAFQQLAPNQRFCFRHKCDGTIDCQDKSDELNCKIIQPDDTYIKELVPMSSKGITEIEIQVKIFSIRNVEPMESKITFHFKAVFTWSDSRLKLADLSMDMSRNVLSHEDMAMIWIPQIILANTLSKRASSIPKR